MSLIPNFEIGWCNGWIGAIPLVLSMIILFIANNEAAKRAATMSGYSAKEKIQASVSTFIFFGAVLYSVGLPCRPGTIWFYVGLIVYAFGCIPYLISVVNFSSTPSDEPIVKGVYKLSRNPMYFFSALTLLAIGIGCASWFMIVLVILYSAINHLTVLTEESYCLRKYGKSYREYVEKTPRYFVFF